jgi:predicted ester cyclase
MEQADRDFGSIWFEEVWNKQRREAITELIAPGALIHEAGETVRGPEGFYPFYDRMRDAFSGLRVTVHDTIAERDTICVRWSCTMKHTGEGLGIPATSKRLETTGITIVRVSGGKAVEAWQNWDMLGVMQQIQETGRAVTYMAGD